MAPRDEGAEPPSSCVTAATTAEVDAGEEQQEEQHEGSDGDDDDVSSFSVSGLLDIVSSMASALVSSPKRLQQGLWGDGGGHQEEMVYHHSGNLDEQQAADTKSSAVLGRYGAASVSTEAEEVVAKPPLDHAGSTASAQRGETSSSSSRQDHVLHEFNTGVVGGDVLPASGKGQEGSLLQPHTATIRIGDMEGARCTSSSTSSSSSSSIAGAADVGPVTTATQEGANAEALANRPSGLLRPSFAGLAGGLRRQLSAVRERAAGGSLAYSTARTADTNDDVSTEALVDGSTPGSSEQGGSAASARGFWGMFRKS
jgi:hypothetical protein